MDLGDLNSGYGPDYSRKTLSMEIGMRTSAHLLLGVVRIYSKKAKYLLADCNDAVIKMSSAFRPGQIDMPVEGTEDSRKDITLIEDFTDFVHQLPQLNNIDVVDHFSLNQSRAEEITLKEDSGTSFLTLMNIGDENQQIGLLDMSFQSLAHRGDAFGDEDTGYDLSDDNREENEPMDVEPMDVEPMDVEPPTLNETSVTTLLANAEEGFILEPVDVTPTLDKKKTGKRRRRLVVDQVKELSDETIREQMADYSDLVVPLHMTAPTRQIMQWRETGLAELFQQLGSTPLAPQITEYFTENLEFGVSVLETDGLDEEVEKMCEDGHEGLNVQRDTSTLTTEDLGVLHASVEPEESLMDYADDDQPEDCSEPTQGENSLEFSHPELPSEDSMFVHPSGLEKETQATFLHPQSMLDSPDHEEKRLTWKAQKLLNSLKSQSQGNGTMFNLQTMCKKSLRRQTAATVFSLLMLQKQGAVDLHQAAPYEDLIITPGPTFYN
ncbi:double-strand-break repair protein rad21-like protein 1 [Diretmus argenteus]